MPLGAALLALLLPLAADTPQPTYLDTLEVRITNLDVVVTDRAGHSVRGLRRENFEVRENGAAQPVTNFSELASSTAVDEATRTGGSAAPVQAAATEASAPPPRKMLFFIDDMALHPLTRSRLLKDAMAFINSSMREGDEAMVVTPSSANHTPLAFTTDRTAVAAQVRDLINHSTWRADSPYDSERLFYDVAVGRSVKPAERHEARRVYAMRVLRRVNGTLRTLLGLAGSMADVAGKKVIVVISASLSATPGSEAFTREDELESGASDGEYDSSSRAVFGLITNSKTGWSDLRPMVRELAATAAASGITIYSLQPDMGVHISPPAGGSDTHSGRRVGTMALSQYQRDITEGTAATLGTLADLTGGKFFQGGAQTSTAFTQVAADLGAYYSLGYHTPEGTNDAFRNVSVTVKGRPDLTVRTRRELLRLSPSKEMDSVVASTLFAPRDVNELAVTSDASRPVRELDHYKVDVTVHVPLSKLTFIPVEGDKYRATFSLHYAAADASDYATGATRQQSVQAAAAELEAVRTKTYSYTTTLVISKGTARIAVGVLDELSRLSSFQRLTVDAR
jgi:VWFA-related protein